MSDEIAAQLTEVIADHLTMWGDMATTQGYVDALLPVVKRIARQHAANALRVAATRACHYDPKFGQLVPTWVLNDRAAALRDPA